MKKNNRNVSLVIYIFFVSIILSLFLIRYFSKKYGKMFYSYAEAEASRIITLIINNSMSKDMFNSIGALDLLNVDRNSKGDIENVDIDIYKETIIIDYVTKKIQKNINAIEIGDVSSLDVNLSDISDIQYSKMNDGIVYYIPMGTIIGSGLLTNVGPLVPIKMVLIGNVLANIDSDIREYGINNAMIEVDINVKVKMLVSFGFISRKIEIDNSRPIIMRIIQGEIPDYYFGNNAVHN